MNKEYLVTQCLPDSGKMVECFGHKTYCCKEDMDAEPEWHKVIFSFSVSSYKLKKEIPKDPEESILEKYEIIECWDIPEDDYEYGAREHVLGVTKWRITLDET